MVVEEKLSKKLVKNFVLATKVLPMIIAAIYFLNSTISFFHGNDIPLNYLGGMSLLPILYLYLASYVFKLCKYYRMYLHYTVVINAVNIYDYYIGISISNLNMYLLCVLITTITMFVIIYLKFFKK